MPRIPGINHLDAARALQKAGFKIVRQGKHIVMSDGTRILTIPRHDPVNAYTLGGIVRDAGLTVEQFRELLQQYHPPTIPVVAPRSSGYAGVSSRETTVLQSAVLRGPNWLTTACSGKRHFSESSATPPATGSSC